MEDEAVDFADDTEISKEDEGNILYLMIELEQALMRVGPEWTATQAKAVTRSAAAYSYADIYAALPVGAPTHRTTAHHITIAAGHGSPQLWSERRVRPCRRRAVRCAPLRQGCGSRSCPPVGSSSGAVSESVCRNSIAVTTTSS
jgi:hypothetical protein